MNATKVPGHPQNRQDNPINIPKIVIEYLTYKCKSYGSVLIILPTKLDDKQKKFIYNDGLNSYNIF